MIDAKIYVRWHEMWRLAKIQMVPFVGQTIEIDEGFWLEVKSVHMTLDGPLVVYCEEENGNDDMDLSMFGFVSGKQENDECHTNLSLREQLYLAADAVRDYSRFVIEDHPLLAKHVDLLMRVVAEVQAEDQR